MEVTEDAIDSDESLNQMGCSDSQLLKYHCYTVTVDPCAACCNKNNGISSLTQRKKDLNKENSEHKLELKFLCKEMKCSKLTAHSRRPFTSVANDRQIFCLVLSSVLFTLFSSPLYQS